MEHQANFLLENDMSSSNPSKLKSDSDNGRDQGTADHRDPAQNEICGRPPNRDEIPKIPSTLRAYYQPILGDLNQEPSHQQLIALTSCKPGEGVSTVATQLAICAAQQGTQVLLIDCNENNPCLHRTFGVKSAKGLPIGLA